MLPYAARAIPFLRIALAGALVTLLMELVRWNPWMLWPLEGIAVGLLAGATAECFDETAAAVADTAPRGLAWTSAARAPAVLLLLVPWTATVLHAGDRALFGHARDVFVQGLAAMAAGAALAVRSRARGSATPGLPIAAAVVPVCTAWALVRPLEGTVPLFPYVDSTAAAWRASTTGWLVLAAVAVAVLAGALGDVGRRRSWPRNLTTRARPAPAVGDQGARR